ncbi:MAG TPA: DUF4062 domain-containing protein [Ktedonobacteraceae bacterium]|nr:DUF4062 domain-containing protein [Ktedonobacteraceae bacterium]
MTTNLPLSLFISSKMQELAEERRAVQSALSDYRMYGWLWEDDAGARPTPTRATYLKEVETCDIYIGLFWIGYGPYTIEEYECARHHRKLCLIYEKHVETDRRDSQLTQFLKGIEKVDNPSGLTVRRFMTVVELAQYIQEDVIRLLTTIFRENRKQPSNLAPENSSFSRTLIILEQVELVDRLLKCAALSNKAQREVVLSLLPTEITQRIIRGNTDITDVLQIVKKCTEYDGGVEKLVKATRFIDGNTRSVEAVVAFLREYSFSL